MRSQPVNYKRRNHEEGGYLVNEFAQKIQQAIESGKYRPGDELPSLEQLCAQYGATEETVQNGLSDLIYEGFLERPCSNRATVRVTKHTLWGTITGNHSFTREAKKRGMEPGVKILRLETVPAWPVVRERLQLQPGDEVTIMERLRLADGKPVALEYSYYPTKLYPGMTAEMFAGGGEEQSSFKVMQEKFGLVPHRAVDEVTTVAIEAREAELLEMDEGTPVLLRFRLTLSEQGVPIKGSRAIYKFKAGYEVGI
jgi:GntR family transcriptional regulator